MKTNWMSSLRTIHLFTAGLALCTIGMTGCGSGIRGSVDTLTKVAFTGHLLGGRTAVSGAAIQLYAAGTTGYGAPSQALLSVLSKSDSNGVFAINSTFTCPGSSTQVYLVATGGDAGGGNNPNLVLLAALGNCGDLEASTSITVNEITTIASTFSLAPFMSAPTSVGTTQANVSGMTHAFAGITRLIDPSSGLAPGKLPPGATAPTDKLNTLADILAPCVESKGGTAGDGSACGKLFAAATPSSGIAPKDTASAALNIARNPGRNVSALLGIVSQSPPFEPTTAAAADFTLSIRFKPSLSKPSASAIDANGNLWITNAGNNTVSVIDSLGTALSGSPLSAGILDQPSAIAIDAAGNAWVTNRNSSILSVFTPEGLGTKTNATGLNVPSAIAIDAQGILWISNNGNDTVTAVTVSGTQYKASTSYSAGGVNAPVSIAVSPN